MQKSGGSNNQNIPSKKNHKPDYGLELSKTEVNQDTKLYFSSFTIYGIDILGQGNFSTMVEMPYNGELHALSLDFNKSQLDTILKQSKSISTQYIKNELLTDPYTPRSINFTEPIVCDIVAKLGTLQSNNEESFVPLILIEASSRKNDQMINNKYPKNGFSIEDFAKKEPYSFKISKKNNHKIERSQPSSKTKPVAVKNKVENNEQNDWWRWLLMPFVSVGGAYIGFFILMLLQYIHPANTGGYLSIITWVIIPIVGKAIFGFIVGLLSYTIAPRGKMIASTVMITLLACFGIFEVILAWYNVHYSLYVKIQVLIGDIVLIIGAIYGAREADKD